VEGESRYGLAEGQGVRTIGEITTSRFPGRFHPPIPGKPDTGTGPVSPVHPGGTPLY